MEDGAAGGAGEGATSRSPGAKRGRVSVVSGSEAETAQGQPPALPPPHGAGTASRIARVRPTGGKAKDRHTKVYTAKGIRDRRVRLSVPVAIQFYDLQDRLAYDQPSKAIEWLLNAAAGAIENLPALDPAAVAAVPKPGEAEVKQQQGSKSGGSSTSETIKGLELSLSRSDGRGGGAAASRDKEVTVASTPAQAASLTELLTAVAEHRQEWQLSPNVSAAAADSVVIAHPQKGADGLSSHAFSVPTGVKFGNDPPFGMVPALPFSFPTSVEMPQLSLSQDALGAASASAGDYTGLLGANMGTLQSDSQSSFSGHQQQQLQKLDGPFLFGEAAAATHPSSENQLTASAALQLWDGFRHSGPKEESKN